MNKKVIIIVAVVIVAIVAAIVLKTVITNKNNAKPEKMIIGTWQGKTNDGLDTAMIFKEEGKIEYDNEYGFDSKGTYEFTGDNKISIKIESWDKAKEYEFEFKDKTTLSLKATDEYSPSYDEMKKVDEYKFESNQE